MNTDGRRRNKGEMKTQEKVATAKSMQFLEGRNYETQKTWEGWH